MKWLLLATTVSLVIVVSHADEGAKCPWYEEDFLGCVGRAMTWVRESRITAADEEKYIFECTWFALERRAWTCRGIYDRDIWPGLYQATIRTGLRSADGKLRPLSDGKIPLIIGTSDDTYDIGWTDPPPCLTAENELPWST